VTATGMVFFNSIGDGSLGTVGNGETATMTLGLDTNDFFDSVPGDLRGYVISSFDLSFSGGASVGAAGGNTNYFTLVDGFPVSDGFFVAGSAVSPGGVELDQSPYFFDLNLGYDGSTLGSLDIADAFGTYEFNGLTRFSMNIWSVFPDNVRLGMDFSSLTIIPAPGAMTLLGLGGLAATRRRRAR